MFTKITKKTKWLQNTQLSNIEKNNVWMHILKKINYDFINDKIVTADEIKKSRKTWNGCENQFEPRLLCKHDTWCDQPYIFQEKNICLLAIENGKYLLTKNNIFVNLKYFAIKPEQLLKNFSSMVLKIGNSECSLIDNLRYSGLFEQKQYLNENIKFGSLLNGRHRCSFDTIFGDKKISIRSVQFETDACYESDNKILLIECKNINSISNFNIRQIYYPYRHMYDSINNKKEIIPLFINKDNAEIIHVWKFKFNDPLIMMSISLVSHDTYILNA